MASRTDTERAAVVFAAWNGARRSAKVADQTTATRADGSS